MPGSLRKEAPGVNLTQGGRGRDPRPRLRPQRQSLQGVVETSIAPNGWLVADADTVSIAPSDSWKGYHYGTACSRDGIHWHGYDDITMQVYARADTLNNVVYDKDSKEYMIFTRIDCAYPPFVDGPSLTNCSHDGQGIRRSARSTSKAFGAGSSWSGRIRTACPAARPGF